MEDGLTEVRDGVVIAAEINIIKVQTKKVVLSASVEIGRLLCEAKELVKFGDWEGWLKEKVDYSQSTANNLMKIYKEYGDEQIDLLGTSKSQTFGNLSYSQAIALFALPAEEREDFVKGNNVEDMTARQLQDAIKAKEQAEKKASDAISEKEKIQNKFDGTNKLLTAANDSKDKLEEALKKADDAKANAEKKLSSETKELREELAKLSAKQAAPPSPEELEQLRADVRAGIEADYKKQTEQLTLEKKTAEDEKAEIEKKYKDKLKQLKLDNESILEQRKAAEKQLALAAPETQKFSVYFENFQRDFQSMEAALKGLTGSGNTETAGKLRGALSKIITGMVGKVGV
jgi:hypothetical protein